MAASTQSERPKVSVLLQTYNHERYIDAAIESVVEQDVPFPIELIVSDDLSSDGTRALVSKHAETHPELIRQLFPKQHLGMNPLFRRALDASQGEYIALLDGDDYWTAPEKLRKQVALLEAEPKLTGCFHDAWVVFENDSRPDSRYVSGKKKGRYEVDDLIRLCYPPTLSVLFRRDVLSGVPDWTFDLAWADWLIWIFATRQGPFAYTDDVMGVYRVHPGGYFSSQARSNQLEEDLRVYGRLLEVLPERRDLIGGCITQRSCELAVEECGLPFDAPLLVVGDFQGLPLLFNGRTTRRLEVGGESAPKGRENTRLEERIEQSCGERVARVRPLWRSRTPPRESGAGRCFVVVPKGSGFGVVAHSDLTAYLRQRGSTLWDDSRCAIYELLAPTAIEVAEVSTPERSDAGVRGRVGQPSAGSVVDSSAIKVVGWALGDEGPVSGIEIESGGGVVWRGSVGADRPDLAEAFPDCGWARKAGFVADVDLQDAIGDEGALEVDVKAVLGNGDRARIGTVTLTSAG